MTTQEFNNWKKETEGSKHHWQVDEVTKRNRGVLLIYIGGENGKYIEVTPDGQATVGKYEGAVPHIGEALFVPLHARKFASQDQAMAALIEKAGLAFLLDLTGSRAYETRF